MPLQLIAQRSQARPQVSLGPPLANVHRQPHCSSQVGPDPTVEGSLIGNRVIADIQKELAVETGEVPARFYPG